jgi:hypothetical protein
MRGFILKYLFFVKTFRETPLSSPKVEATPIKPLHGSQTKYGLNLN